MIGKTLIVEAVFLITRKTITLRKELYEVNEQNDAGTTSMITRKSIMPTATEMKNTSLDAKREECRKYLEKEGALEHLTKHLVPLYEKAD